MTSNNYQRTTQRPNSTENIDNGIDYAGMYMRDDEDEERLREKRLFAVEEGNGANLNRRLLAPPNEIQHRNRQPKKQA